MIYSGFWKRFSAACLDGFVVYLVLLIVDLLIRIIAPYGSAAVETSSMSYILLRLVLIVVILGIYFAWMESSKLQATLGKMALGIIVVNANNDPISFWQATSRYWAKWISNLTCFIGYVMSGFTSKRQALHDIMASTYVADKNIMKAINQPQQHLTANSAATGLAESNRMLYAGFWKRFFAYYIDSYVIYIVSLIVNFIAMIIFGTLSMVSVSTLFSNEGEMSENFESGLAIVLGISLLAINIIVSWLYYAFMESSNAKATLGKMALGIAVMDENQEKISFVRASGRFFSKIISAITLGVGYIMTGFTKRKQGLHDKIAQTYVFDKKLLDCIGQPQVQSEWRPERDYAEQQV